MVGSNTENIPHRHAHCSHSLSLQTSEWEGILFWKGGETSALTLPLEGFSFRPEIMESWILWKRVAVSAESALHRRNSTVTRGADDIWL